MFIQLRKSEAKKCFSVGTIQKMILRKSAEDAEEIRKAEDLALMNRVLDEMEKKFILVPRDSAEGKRLCQT
jgi:predicted AAA+ superfamily ATPase